MSRLGAYGGWQVAERCREDVVIVRFTRDPKNSGDPTGAPVEHVLRDCLVAPVISNDTVERGNPRTTTRYQITARDPDADVLATDRCRRPSDPTPSADAIPRERGPWRILGDPARWTPGVSITIERATA